MEKPCNQCGNLFPKKVNDSKKAWIKKKYCSQKCYGTYLRENPSPTGYKNGHKHSKETIKKLSEATKRNPQRYWKGKFGEEHSAWVGDKISVNGVHSWIEKIKGKTKRCEHCGTTESPKFEWANRNHKYRRKVEDWMRLCTKCHFKYDKENGLRYNSFTHPKDFT